MSRKKHLIAKKSDYNKICSKCLKEKPKDEFYRDFRNKDGRMSRCKYCHKQTVVAGKERSHT